MAKKENALNEAGESFGHRLARLRKAAGYTQRQLAPKIGISQRMLAYYEKQTDRPPATLVPVLAQVLGVSADELLGIKPLKSEDNPTDPRLRRRLKKLEQLPPKERGEVIKLIDLFLERDQLRRQTAPAHQEVRASGV